MADQNIYIDSSVSVAGVGSEIDPYKDFSDINWDDINNDNAIEDIVREVTGADLNSVSNALNPSSDSDATTGWSQSGLAAAYGTFETEDTIVNSGSYSFLAHCNTNPSGTGSNRIYTDIQAAFSLVNGTKYEISFDIRHVGVVASGQGKWTGTVNATGRPINGPSVIDVTIDDTTWQNIRYRFVHETDVTKYLGIGENNADEGGGVYVDNLSCKALAATGDIAIINLSGDFNTETLDIPVLTGPITGNIVIQSNFSKISRHERLSDSAWTDAGGNIWTTPVLLDVANVIFDNTNVGVKVWNEVDLTEQDEFWNDKNNNILKMYSTTDPGNNTYVDVVYNEASIEFADGAEYYTIQNLHATKCGRSGIEVAEGCENINILYNKVSWIGGGENGDTETRYGNGINLRNINDTITIMGNMVWSCYDSGIALQGPSASLDYSNINILLNVVWDCRYNFEFWQAETGTSMENVLIAYNTAFSARGWGRGQRTTPKAYHIRARVFAGTVTNLEIKYNIFSDGVNVSGDSGVLYIGDIDKLDIDNNIYYPGSLDFFADIDSTEYSAEQFAAYQTAVSQDENSILSDPYLTSVGRLKISSAAINNGSLIAEITGQTDAWGSSVSDPPNIGAYQGIGVDNSIKSLFLGTSFAFGLMTGGLCLGGGGLFLSSSGDSGSSDPVLKEDGTAALTESGETWLKE